MVRMETNEAIGTQTNCFNKFKKTIIDFDTYEFRPHFTIVTFLED